MQQDSLTYDTTASRPLPKWLTDQKEGITLYKPREVIVKEDHSLVVSFVITGLAVLFLVVFISILVKKRR